jgi:hypothetical protein
LQNPKIFILLPDGVGLRNFAYTNFYQLGKTLGYDIVFWNLTAFNLEELGLDQIKITEARLHPKTDVLKKAKALIELNRNIKRGNDKVYESYKHKLSYKNTKEVLKSLAVKWYTFRYNSERGLKSVRENLQIQERKTKYYHDCLETLQREKPAIVFCTNHRTTQALAPIAAAKDLGIPTATFIFSWDNLPKATKVIETDYYFVWSEHMKGELLYYYPYINEEQVFITGTPQFEGHFNPALLLSRDAFFSKYGLDATRKYICYSGDDVTTSPHDPQFLADVANAVRELNSNGHNLGIIFRRAPVDFSARFDAVLEGNKDIITSLKPEWKKIGGAWNTVLPTKEDMVLQASTIAHTEMVINLGSSMVFDYVAHGKPCAFINYNGSDPNFPQWSVEMIYKYVHFRSMPDKEVVVWLNSAEEIAPKLESVINGKIDTVSHAQKWFETINQHPPELASSRILEAMGTIIDRNKA